MGGGKLNSSFYAKGLVDETWITVNPIILGEGRPFISNFSFEIQLELMDIVKFNKGLVQLKYRVVRET